MFNVIHNYSKYKYDTENMKDLFSDLLLKLF